MNIETIWKHIRFCEGQVFKTVRGVEYTYLVYDNYLLIHRYILILNHNVYVLTTSLKHYYHHYHIN